MHRLSSLTAKIRDAVMLTSCGVCEKETDGDCICEECLNLLDSSRSPIFTYMTGDVLCASYFAYEFDPVRSLIIAMKHRITPSAYNYSAKILAGLVARLEIDGDVVFTAVPRSGVGMRKYGFDQVFEMAKRTVKLVPNSRFLPLIKRNKGSAEQKRLSAKEREQNLVGKFSASRPPFFRKEIKNIVVFDDVTTTGSSIKESARALREAFPNAEIFAVTLAHNPQK